MSFFRKNGMLVFFILLLIHCVFVYLDHVTARQISKALLLPSLILYVAAAAGRAVHWLAYAGLVFSFLGDVLLLGKGDGYFLAGMLAFVGTHLCNSFYFLRQTDHSNTRLREAFFAAILLMVLSITVFGRLNESLGGFRIPVFIYMLVISIMAILAANLAGCLPLRKIAWNCFIPGAGLFVISDTTLALNKFLYHQPQLDIVVIFTYGVAEYFLVKGFVAMASTTTPLKANS
jgi:uncharacterized membrane protein YhhN